MINIEAVLFTKLSKALKLKYKDIFITGEFVAAPPSFPCVSIIEIGNSTYQRSLTEAGQENHATLTYDIQIFSNKKKGKKTECRAIASTVDEVMLDLFFTRTMLEPITNLADSSVYRIAGRYTAVVSADGVIYRK